MGFKDYDRLFYDMQRLSVIMAKMLSGNKRPRFYVEEIPPH